MKYFPSDINRIGALITILILSVGSISVVGLSHVATASQIGKLCIIFACGNANITGGTSSNGGGGGGGGGGQPIPTTGKLIVTKKVVCLEPECDEAVPSDFHITVTGDNPSPNSFQGSGPPGTEVTLGAGNYKVDEERCPNRNEACVTLTGGVFLFDVTFSADCTGSINAGETKQCTVTNRESPLSPL